MKEKVPDPFEELMKQSNMLKLFKMSAVGILQEIRRINNGDGSAIDKWHRIDAILEFTNIREPGFMKESDNITNSVKERR